MKFEIENSVISSYKRLSYDAWYAFAEFVDNSTQAYFDNRAALDLLYNKNGDKLTISINYDRENDLITITDNSMGMNEVDLIRAFKVGQPPENPNGRSKYGLGMKTASCWFGDRWSITTKKLGEISAYTIEIDVAAIASHVGEVELIPTLIPSSAEEHYTVLLITDLNRKFVGKTLWKIKDYLSSIYRFDISEGIEILWNNVPLVWTGYEDELYVTEEGVRYKKLFEFEINEKPVKGWVGVLGEGFGSRKKTGFSIIQNRRVIQVSYKPTTVYGEQEDGGNDLINQRVTGELMLDRFSVSHTKDKIVWEDDEEDQLNEKLGNICADARELARTLRYRKQAVSMVSEFMEEATTVLTSEFKSNEVTDYLNTATPYPEKIIQADFNRTAERISNEVPPDIYVEIGSDENVIKVSVFFSSKSEFEPYVLIETTIEENKLTVIINTLHPHFQEMKSSDSFINFIRHSVYDGVAEWRAIKLRGTIQPYTIKFFKDGLLRIPFTIKQNKAL